MEFLSKKVIMITFVMITILNCCFEIGFLCLNSSNMLSTVLFISVVLVLNLINSYLSIMAFPNSFLIILFRGFYSFLLFISVTGVTTNFLYESNLNLLGSIKLLQEISINLQDDSMKFGISFIIAILFSIASFISGSMIMMFEISKMTTFFKNLKVTTSN